MVNNCAAAVLLATASLAGDGREVVVSRGQLIEIGGSFRIPDVVAQSGAALREVGTTNRTRAARLRRRAGRAHRRDPARAPQQLPRRRVRRGGLDRGAVRPRRAGRSTTSARACLPTTLPLLADEPSVRRSVRAGAALVCFSGDKLLGGPQAGHDRRHARRRGRGSAPPACARVAHRQALAGGGRGDARALSRPRARAPRDSGARDARVRPRGAAARARAARRARSAARWWRPWRRSAAARCRCSSSRGPPWRCTAGARTRRPRGCAPATRRCSRRIQDGRVLLDPRTMADEEVAWVAAALR